VEHARDDDDCDGDAREDLHADDEPDDACVRRLPLSLFRGLLVDRTWVGAARTSFANRFLRTTRLLLASSQGASIVAGARNATRTRR
jgi:hypothetical protein